MANMSALETLETVIQKNIRVILPEGYLRKTPSFFLTGFQKKMENSKQLPPEFFNLRPEVERNYGYSHAVKIGNSIKISGAVSMDDSGAATAVGNFLQQMINCYSDLEKVLKHYGCSFDDVIVENVFTTDMAAFLEHAGHRSTIYTKQFPTGSWLEVKGLALPEFLIEIELEAEKPNH
jgi:2-iminobutanoate/2-iminopropanoate deaminase